MLGKQRVWTADNVVKSPFEDVDIPDTCVCEYVWKDLDKWSHKTAVVCGITGRQYTYEQLYKQSQTLAAKLRKTFQIKDGDTVAIVLPNMPEYPAVVLGVFAAGGVVSTMNPLYTPNEVQHQITISEPKAFFVVVESAPVVKEALRLSGRDVPIITIHWNNDLPEGTSSYKELIDDSNMDLSVLKEVKRNHDDVALLLYSSGTTGLPKGVELTHRNIVVNFKQQDTEIRFYDYTAENNQDIVLALIPMFHIYGLNLIMLHGLSVGLKIVILPGFQPKIILDVLAKHRINHLFVAPPTVLFLGSCPQITPEHFAYLKCVLSGAAPLPPADIERLIAKFNHRDVYFAQMYGMTETGPLALASPKGYKNYKSIGFPLPNVELRVVDQNFKNLGPNEVGELLIKGPNIMRGYKDNAEANERTFVDGGWLRTGDLVTIDENGSAYIHDRLKDIIKVSGFSVAPAELESVIKEHPAVFDAAIAGVKDPKSGERPQAFVVLNDGFQRNSAEIVSFVNGRVAPYKKIKEKIVFLDAIPKNPSGKILRKILIEKFT